MVRIFFALAVICVILGVMWHFGYRLGSLPGDVTIDRGNTRMLLPLGSCILISFLLTALLRIFRRNY